MLNAFPTAFSPILRLFVADPPPPVKKKPNKEQQKAILAKNGGIQSNKNSRTYQPTKEPPEWSIMHIGFVMHMYLKDVCV